MIYVKEQLGHSGINVTVDLYGHIRPGANREAVDRLAALTGKLEPPQTFDFSSTTTGTAGAVSAWRAESV